MNVFIDLISLLWLVRIVANLFSYIHLWFVKEYRFDRMRIHLGTSQGRRLLFLPFRRPPLSPKTVILGLLGSLSLFSINFLIPGHMLLRLFIVDLLTFPMISFWVAILKLPTWVFHQYQIRRALTRLGHHKPMLVIGITGSFGKTSTKEFLATILSQKYKVLKTEMSKNSPIGIAEAILERLEPDHEIFIVEMGAYKKDEIAYMSQMVKPQIGIITAINPQHQDLFKTIETTMRAKFELVENLVGKQIAIFNYDNEKTREMAHWAKKAGKKMWFFSQEKDSIKGATLIKGGILMYAKNIFVRADRIEFTVVLGKEEAHVVVNVLGKHQVSNILGALAAAVNSGMTLKEAASAAALIKPFTKTMELVVGVNGAAFINDTFNNNPDAVKAALDYLKETTQGKKILVFQPMIELGDYTENTHKEVGAYAAKVCDEIYLTNQNFNDAFMSGVRSVNKEKSVVALPPHQTAEQIRRRLKKGDTVLFKGKETENVLRRLIIR